MIRFRQWYGIAVILLSGATFANQIKCFNHEAHTIQLLTPRVLCGLLAALAFMGGLVLMKSGDRDIFK
jgi:hypothetical protein